MWHILSPEGSLNCIIDSSTTLVLLEMAKRLYCQNINCCHGEPVLSGKVSRALCFLRSSDQLGVFPKNIGLNTTFFTIEYSPVTWDWGKSGFWHSISINKLNFEPQLHISLKLDSLS